MVQKVVHIFFTERSWWSAYAKIVLWGESVLLERDIMVRLFCLSLDFLTKCTWLNVLGLEFQTLCRQTFVRSGRCAYFSSSPMVFSVLLCERPGRLFTCILWYRSRLVKAVIKKCLPLFRFILPSERPSVMACSAFTPQTCHISSIHNRVSKVVAHHEKLLTQWMYI